MRTPSVLRFGLLPAALSLLATAVQAQPQQWHQYAYSRVRPRPDSALTR